MKQFFGANFVIDCAEQSITVCGVVKSVRPKTFQLLVSLINQRGKVVSKQSLLASIWDDVHVEEHVVVQSITELRKVFEGQTVIKTQPRKGYCWVAAVASREIDLTLAPTLPTASQQGLGQQELSQQRPRHLTFSGFAIAGAFIVLLVVAAVWAQNQRHEGESANGSVFILPTVNRMMDSKFDWVSLGVMDTLISQAQDHNRIMPIDYVLSSMRLAKMKRDYDDEQIARLAQITGAHTVVSSELSRRLGEFQLVYQLNQRSHVKRGVLLGRSLDDLIDQFAQVVSSVTSLPSNRINIVDSPFNHELFVEAIEQSRQGKQQSAVMLLKSLLSLEPNNLEAYLTLIDWLQYQGDYQQALRFSAQALAIIGDKEAEQASFYYRHGYSLYRLGALEQARVFSNKLKQSLTLSNNPLYFGYSFQLEGELLFAQGDYILAQQAFTRAQSYFESVGHSIGVITVHILMANTYAKLGEEQARQQHLELARGIVKKYDLDGLLDSFKIELPH